VIPANDLAKVNNYYDNLPNTAITGNGPPTAPGQRYGAGCEPADRERKACRGSGGAGRVTHPT
jgi:hypothetical protein